MKNARHLDASTVMAMEYLHDYLRETGRYLLISGSNPEVTRVLENSGLLAKIGRENIFPAEANPTVATRNALKRAKELLPENRSTCASSTTRSRPRARVPKSVIY